MSESPKSQKELFSDQELMRYSRHIMLPQLDVEGQLSLANSTVLIVGVGGLGAAVTQYLAASGVGEMLLADHDIVEESNLQRQIIHTQAALGGYKVESAKKAVEAINPNVTVRMIKQSVGDSNLPEFIQQVDLVIDCCDNFSTRIAINKACKANGKILVSGAAIRFEGQITTFDFRRDDSPCYQCLYDLTGNENLSCSEAGVLSPLVGVIGSYQAVEAIKCLTGAGKNLCGRVQIFDGLQGQWREFRVKQDPECSVCGLKA